MISLDVLRALVDLTSQDDDHLAGVRVDIVNEKWLRYRATQRHMLVDIRQDIGGVPKSVAEAATYHFLQGHKGVTVKREFIQSVCANLGDAEATIDHLGTFTLMGRFGEMTLPFVGCAMTGDFVDTDAIFDKFEATKVESILFNVDLLKRLMDALNRALDGITGWDHTGCEMILSGQHKPIKVMGHHVGDKGLVVGKGLLMPMQKGEERK